MVDDLQVQARALGDPTRHRIFRFVAEATEPPSVPELTAAFGLNHNAIRQHLAKLEAAGLVVGEVGQGSGRGRPSRRYSVRPGADSRWGVAGPYERLAAWLAEVVRTGDSPFEVGRRVGAVEGSAHRPPGPGAAPDPVAAVVDVMARGGFEPVRRDRDGRVELVLQRCPFVTTAVADPDVVCELHHGIATGVADAVGGVIVDELVRADPQRAGCRLRCHVEPGPPSAPVRPEDLGGETACWAHLVDELDGAEGW